MRGRLLRMLAMSKPLIAAFAGAMALAMLAAAPAMAETIESATTAFNVDKCPHTAGSAPEDGGVWRCKGYGGIAVVMSEGDIRVHVSFGPRALREPAASETLGAPNGEGTSIEWRIARERDGKRRPFATIMHWTTRVMVDASKDDEEGTVRGEVLVVTRLGPGGVCHVGYVDGRQNPNADDLAREIADQHARSFRCGKDRPIVLGDKGPGFSGPYGGDDE
jgi:hypothetical protein